MRRAATTEVLVEGTNILLANSIYRSFEITEIRLISAHPEMRNPLKTQKII